MEIEEEEISTEANRGDGDPMWHCIDKQTIDCPLWIKKYSAFFFITAQILTFGDIQYLAYQKATITKWIIFFICSTMMMVFVNNFYLNFRRYKKKVFYSSRSIIRTETIFHIIRRWKQNTFEFTTYLHRM